MTARFTIRTRILVILVFVAAVSAGASSFAAFYLGRQTLEQEAFDKLTAVRELKADQIENYFRQIRDQVVTFSEDRMIVEAMRSFKTAFQEIAADTALDEERLAELDQRLRLYYQNELIPRLSANLENAPSLSSYWPSNTDARILQGLYIAENLFETGAKHLLDKADDGSRYSRLHGLYHPLIRNYLERFGYYDIFLVDHETGEIVYSVFKEVDFGTSLLHGPYRDSGFSDAFRAASGARAGDFVGLEDFQPYHPSYNAEASFIASPIFDGEEQLGVLLFQMPIDRINRIMTSNQAWRDVGLGETGETYIVADDFTMRNQSRFLIEDKANYLDDLRQQGVPDVTVNQIANLDNVIGLQEVRTAGTEQALGGASGTVIFDDYRGESVLSAFRPLDIKDVSWVLMSEVDQSEAFVATKALQQSMLFVFFILVLGSMVLAFFFSRGLTRPLRELTQRANDLAEGNLDVEIETRGKDEIAHLAHSFDSMRESLKSLVTRQEAAIEALSTPLIPLRDGVVVMPLVGDFDRGRIDRLRETLVDGIHREGARVTIIDVTGVPAFDPEFAQGLARVSTAARLLGAIVVLTGVQPKIARGMADVGERLEGVATRRSLQEGIDFALSNLTRDN